MINMLNCGRCGRVHEVTARHDPGTVTHSTKAASARWRLRRDLGLGLRCARCGLSEPHECIRPADHAHRTIADPMDAA